MAKAQAGVEYLMVTAILLIALFIIFAYSLTLYNQNIATAKASSAVEALASAAEQAASLGEGTTLFVTIELPQEAHSGTTSEHLILVKVDTFRGTTDFYEITKAKLSDSSLPTESGFHEIKVEVVGGEVVFTEV